MNKKKKLFSSISHKYFIAAAGAFLMLFLLTHLSTNLLLLAGDGERFNETVQFLLTNPVIRIIEYVLFAGFIIHIVFGLVIKVYNDRARPISYLVSSKSKVSPFSKYMFVTGIVIFGFLIIHLYNFFMVKVGIVPVYGNAANRTDFFPMVATTLKNPIFAVFYMLSVIILGFHLKHGFQSAFQSFGLNHDKYFPAIKVIGWIYTVIIVVGFLIIPVYFLFIY